MNSPPTKNRPIHLSEVIEVEREIDDVFRYLLDFSTIEQWDPGVYRAHKTTPGPVQAGTRFEIDLNLPLGRQPMSYELVHVVPGKALVLKGTGVGFTVKDTITLEPTGTGRTRIHYSAELAFTGARRLLAPAMQPLLQRIGRKAVNGLKTALTISPPMAPKPHITLEERLLVPAAANFTERGYLKMANKGLSECMHGKTAVVTGPTSGLGLASACELARLGARVALVGRDRARLETARKAIQDFSGCSDGDLPLYCADLSLLADVRRVAGEILNAEKNLDVVINNAGALFSDRQETPEGHERALAINLLAPWLLTNALLPRLKASNAHVINVASGGMYLQPVQLRDMQYRQGKYDGSKAYARAKRAMVDTTEHLAAMHPDVRFNAMHPGWAATPGVSKSLPGFEKVIGKRLRDSRMGADTIIWLASSTEASKASGYFWFDRVARPTAVIAGTATSPADRHQLIAWLEQTTGEEASAA